MSWNYRVVKSYNKLFENPIYGIREVYYEISDDGVLHHSSLLYNLPPYGGSMQELINDLRLMNEAFSKPVLELKGDEYGKWTLIELENE